MEGNELGSDGTGLDRTGADSTEWTGLDCMSVGGEWTRLSWTALQKTEVDSTALH